MAETKSAKPVKKIKEKIYFYAVGRRKTAVARVRLFPDGEGNVEINGQTYSDFIKQDIHDEKALAPLRLLGKSKKFDFAIKVSGGGLTSQAEAIRHGIARALVEYEADLRPELKQAGYLRRNPRRVERKKFGLKKARRRPQWSKR